MLQLMLFNSCLLHILVPCVKIMVFCIFVYYSVHFLYSGTYLSLKTTCNELYFFLLLILIAYLCFYLQSKLQFECSSLSVNKNTRLMSLNQVFRIEFSREPRNKNEIPNKDFRKQFWKRR